MRSSPIVLSSIVLSSIVLAGALLLPIAACDTANPDGPEVSQQCQDFCTELVTECGYQAFPDFDSCLQGCAWDEKEGADVHGNLTCVQDAVCDVFVILECEHTYGLDD